MMKNIFAADFETTVYDGQTSTEVWCAATAKLYTDDVLVFHSIKELFHYYFLIRGNIVVYFHNLKFDGAFILHFLIEQMHYKQAFDPDMHDFVNRKDMENGTFIVNISDFGQWYSIEIKQRNRIIEIRDSLKLLPFTLKEIGEGFHTKHQKLDMEYKGYRYSGCTISEEELAYIRNDILVLKEALEIMFDDGYTKLTIGACCLSEFKAGYASEYSFFFPNLYQIEIDEEQYGSPNAGEYIHNAYRGGWCYVAEGKSGKVKKNGVTLDVNSLYPSMMHSESGNYYPIGKPTFFEGDPPDWLKDQHKYYFVRFICQFELKPGYLPFVQIKRNWLYPSNVCLKTSDIYDRETGKYYHYHKTMEGDILPCSVELTMSQTDFELFQEHYNVDNCLILDGCYFDTDIGLFDRYINKYREIKQNSKGAKRSEAKLCLNSLYGKLAMTTDNSFKTVYIGDDKLLHTETQHKMTKTPGYIAIGAAITSYARNFTIRAAQQNYYGKNHRGFIYADTDSIHCDLPLEKIKGVKLDDKAFCAWKCEANWKEAIFVRPKTYVEIENDKPIIKCAGLSKHGKKVVSEMLGYETDIHNKLTEEEKEFVESHDPSLESFKRGITIPNGKLLPQRYPGGIVLKEIPFEMR